MFNKIKNYLIRFINNLKYRFAPTAYVYNGVKIYLREKRKIRDKANFTKLVKNDFIKTYNVNPDDISALMIEVDKAAKNLCKNYLKNPVVMTDSEYREFLLNQLAVNATKINALSKKPVFLYKPEIIDIHNEKTVDEGGKSLTDLINADNLETRNIIKHQVKSMENAVKRRDKDWWERSFGKKVNMH